MSQKVTNRGKIIAFLAVTAALVLAGAVVFEIDRRPRTRDARIFAYSATMASEINGRIVKLLVTNDQIVKQGDPLLLIDPKPYEFQLQQARSQVGALKAQIVQAHEALGDKLSLEAQLEGAQAVEGLAARSLDLTTLRAPFGGIVVGLRIADGTFALSGRPLFSLIKSEAWYAVANFREMELGRIAVGDSATIWPMARSTRPLEGTVESLGAGVQSSDQYGPDLPKTGRDLNWVVAAQRFPVWVRLDHPPPEVMHVGMTASVRVHRADAR